MNWSALLIGVISSTCTALLIDLQGFAAARKADPTAKFDWCLTGVRVGIGFLTGVVSGLGAGAVTQSTTGGLL